MQKDTQVISSDSKMPLVPCKPKKIIQKIYVAGRLSCKCPLTDIPLGMLDGGWDQAKTFQKGLNRASRGKAGVGQGVAHIRQAARLASKLHNMLCHRLVVQHGSLTRLGHTQAVHVAVTQRHLCKAVIAGSRKVVVRQRFRPPRRA